MDRVVRLGRTVSMATGRLLLAALCTVVAMSAAHVRNTAPTSISVPGGHILNYALHHFEVLHVNHLRQSIVGNRPHHSTGNLVQKLVYFRTLGRDFTLLLRPRRQLLQQFVEVNVIDDNGSRVHPVQLDAFFEGTVHGEIDSIVLAHVDPDTGVLTASIELADEHYYVEPSHVHFPESHDFHMISYRSSDLKYNLTKDPSEHFCGNSEHFDNAPSSPVVVAKPDSDQRKPWGSKVVKGLGSRLGVGDENRQLRRRRAVSGDACPLHLVASYQFFSKFGHSVNAIVRLMLLVVDLVNQIFRKTVWNSELQGLGFTVTNVTVYGTSSGEGVPIYNSVTSFDSVALLELFSQNRWDHACLAHLFTFINLSGNRLGVAYIASDDSDATGGICSEYSRVNGEDTTANVGVSSYVNDGRPLLLAEGSLVTSHELGHNWGAEHDPTDTTGPCNPPQGTNAGKFLMFPSATDGSQANNDDFSPCSKDRVSDVLEAVGTCFIDSTVLQCGNYEVEEGEECDSGVFGMVDLDPCCSPQCRYKEGAICSDVNEQCCSACQFAANDTTCAEFADGNSECRHPVTCRGDSSSCPVNEVEGEEKFVPIESGCGLGGQCYPPGTQCNNDNCTYSEITMANYSVTCFDFCERKGMTLCFCSGDDECYFCCESSSTGCGMYPQRTKLPDGTTCVGGYCDNGDCVPATQDLVQRLFTLFSDFSANAFGQFIKENIVGSVCFIVLLVWLPIAIPVCIYDWKRWKEHEKVSMAQEAERQLLDEEDEIDEHLLEELMTTTPGFVSPYARLGLVRTNSRSDSSSHNDFFGPDENVFIFPAVFSPGAFGAITSPTKPMDPFKAARLTTIAEVEESGRLDPELDNIRVHLGTSPRPSFDASGTAGGEILVVASTNGGMETVEVNEGGSWVDIDKKD